MIWPKEVTLVSRTQPPGPLCLWKCFTDQLNSKNSNIYCRECCNYNVKLQGTVIDISSLLTDGETISSCTISIITVSTRGQINTVTISTRMSWWPKEAVSRYESCCPMEFTLSVWSEPLNLFYGVKHFVKNNKQWTYLWFLKHLLFHSLVTELNLRRMKLNEKFPCWSDIQSFPLFPRQCTNDFSTILFF